MKKIAMVIAFKDFQDTEFEVPYKFFRDMGAHVDVYSTKKGKAKGKLGMEFKVEHTMKDFDPRNYDAIAYVGGPGTPTVRKDESAVNAARVMYREGKIVAAICWSPTILAKAGVLEGKKATVWYGADDEYNVTTDKVIERFGARYTKEPVVRDGRIITAEGPTHAGEFAEKIWEALNGT
jgi:protease I